ncbi:MAG: biotin/lipoyl-binding protein [Eubacteriales bacterium]|nr:biotin/lipoyl-binding protein [Eubacteriales bacterium]
MKRKIMGFFAGFLALMLMFTFLSRAADSMTIAKVTVKKAERGKIPHQVTGSGKVVQNREQAVSTLAGQTVKTIYVEEGQQVEKGDVLFEIDLESLKEQILNQKQEMKKADLTSQDKESDRDAKAYKDALSQNRAVEDYNVAAGKGNTSVGRAAAELNSAKKKLKSLEQNEGSGTGTDPVEEVLKQTCEQKQKEYEEAVEYKEELEEAIDAAVQKALEEAKSMADTASVKSVEWEVHMSAQEMVSSEAVPGTIPEFSESSVNEPAVPDMPEELTFDETPEELPVEIPPDVPNSEIPAESSDTEESDKVQSEVSAETQTEAPEKEPSADVNNGNDEFIIGDEPQVIESEETEGTADLWLLEQRIRQENQTLLDEAEEQIKAKEQEKEAADAALVSYQQKKAAGEQTSAEEMKQQIKEEIRVKQQAYEDAVTAANDSLRTAGRAVEDANAPQGTDSTGEIDAITREQEELKLEKLERLMDQNGKVTAPIDAMITKVNLITGEKTPDGTAILLSDTAAGNKLVVQVSKEQEKYIAKGDEVKVKTNSKNSQTLEELTVDTVRINEEDKELLDVTVQLPADSLEAGVSATMEATRTSDAYECCIPIQALYEENGKYFVYVMEESSSVLGTELTARRVDVTVLDKNETNAALQQGNLGSDQNVIVSSDKMISDGSRIRIKEE